MTRSMISSVNSITSRFEYVRRTSLDSLLVSSLIVEGKELVDNGAKITFESYQVISGSENKSCVKQLNRIASEMEKI